MRKVALAAAALATAGSTAYVAWPSAGTSPVPAHAPRFIPFAKLSPTERPSMSPLANCVYRRGPGRLAVLVEGEDVNGVKVCPPRLQPSRVVNWRGRCDPRSGYSYVSVYYWCHYRP